MKPKENVFGLLSKRSYWEGGGELSGKVQQTLEKMNKERKIKP